MYNIYIFWTGDNELTENRVQSIENLKTVTQCNIILVDKTNLHTFILDEHPLHESYQYLSETHRSDYLRCYFMHFYGGGYTDIKATTFSWVNTFEILYNSDKWILGYPESDKGCIAYTPYCQYYRELIGNGAYISKKNTPLTQEWYNKLIALMNEKLETLKQFPSTFPQDCAEISKGKYPIEWNEMLGRIFHKVCYENKDKIIIGMNRPILYNYR